uniref:Uncharacterized protein n=1 Tax=Arundo donax TaxID=35708 RepID=A0A0A9E2D1_ARUDO
MYTSIQELTSIYPTTTNMLDLTSARLQRNIQ